MLSPKYLALGSLTAGLIVAAVYYAGHSEALMDEREIFERNACAESISQHLGPNYKVDKVFSHINSLGGYTVSLNKENVPMEDIRAGVNSDPSFSWAAECSSDGHRNIVLIGIYDFDRGNVRMWTSETGWVLLGPKPAGKPAPKSLEV